ncbi:carboxymethylenebutenolidase homolog isoform X1 [Rhinoderma darwinii]|uniref:carboxymethylenebutenolidase homolog isoform X1 n=1 Tax=Rhinoderma darwinii TaxID=43563 RepID=UPI003F66EC70
MANESNPCPCDIGDKLEYGGKGCEIQIDHIKAYVSKPLCSTDKAVIVVQDIYGWKLPNTQFIADLIASHGYIAICPDFFVGQEPWKSSNDWNTFSEWLKTRKATEVDRETDVVLNYLKTECRVTKIAVVGFCWGGIVTHHLMLNYPELKAGISFYGIISDTEDRYNLLNPTLFIFAENDPIIPLERVHSLEEKLKMHATVEFKVKLFPNQTHGFAHRKNENINPEDKPQIEEARKDMIEWLQKFIN